MNRLALYLLLRQHEQLKARRHPMFEKNRFMKVLFWFMVAYYAALMIFLGVTLPLGMSRGQTAAFHILDGGFFYLLIADFWMRFGIQETPAQQAQAYALLPIRRSFLMHVFLGRSMTSLINVYWSFFLVPFGMVSVLPLLGWWPFVGWLVGWWLMFVANGLAYQYVRALCLRHILWFLVPLALHATLVCVALLPQSNVLRLPFIHFLYAFAQGNPLPYAGVLAVIVFAYVANYRLHRSMVYNEVAKQEEVELKHATQFAFLNRYGAMGEYLKMEIRLRIRNKQVRVSFLVGLGMMVFFALMQYFTEVYDGSFMTTFICTYNYILLGMMTLVTILCHEGNYIDGLMARRESILALLKAKYYFNTLLLLIPFLILLPLILQGKQSLWMNLSLMAFSAGCIYPLLFQMAVYNRETIPLNQKITGKQGNMTQQIVSTAVLFLPIAIAKGAVLLLGEPWGHVLLMVLGLAGVATHRLWLRNIYRRFMLRRHTNMEGFRASRNP